MMSFCTIQFFNFCTNCRLRILRVETKILSDWYIFTLRSHKMCASARLRSSSTSEKLFILYSKITSKVSITATLILGFETVYQLFHFFYFLLNSNTIALKMKKWLLTFNTNYNLICKYQSSIKQFTI